MERVIAVLVAASALAVAQVEDNRVVSKRFPVSGAEPEIVVSIINGGIKVTAGAGNEVVLNAKVHYEAQDKAALDELEKNLRFDSEQRGNNVWIGVEGEDRGGSGWNRPREFGWRKPPAGSDKPDGRRWRFRHDVELHVPRNAHLKLSTINGGLIDVDGVAGEFQLSNVNGGIDVKHAGGFGKAKTVNGAISMGFDKTPGGPSGAKTVNGAIKMYLAKNVSADFKFKTVRGSVYSDFAPAGQPAVPAAVPIEERGMKRIWSTDRSRTLRVGQGGPVIEAEGVNTDIHVYEAKN
ncbi:MAG: hypothetical protein U0Q16_08165 [Bryobacteraceae bacterium]